MQRFITDWDDTYVRVIGFIEADQQLRSVAPGLALVHEDRREILAAGELILAHRTDVIDFTDPGFAMTEALVLAILADLEERCDVKLTSGVTP